MNTLKEIRNYPSNLTLVIIGGNEETYLINLDYDGCAGEWSRDCWKKLDDTFIGLGLSDEDNNKILDALEQTSNEPFFIDN